MKITKILCVSDMSAVSKNADRVSILMAYNLNAQLTILSCGAGFTHKSNSFFDENIIQPTHDLLTENEYQQHELQKKAETQDYFEKIQKDLNIVSQFKIEVRFEDAVSACLEYLEQNSSEIDLIIVGKETSSQWERLLFGSQAKEICDESNVSTLLIPSNLKFENWIPTGVVSCKSFEEESFRTELMGALIAEKFLIPMTILHIINQNYEKYTHKYNFKNIYPIDYIPTQELDVQLDSLVSESKKQMELVYIELKSKYSNIQIDLKIDSGQVLERVHNFINENSKNNLLIIGSKGENALKRFLLGSHVDVLEENCEVPILVVFHQKN